MIPAPQSSKNIVQELTRNSKLHSLCLHDSAQFVANNSQINNDLYRQCGARVLDVLDVLTVLPCSGVMVLEEGRAAYELPQKKPTQLQQAKGGAQSTVGTAPSITTLGTHAPSARGGLAAPTVTDWKAI